ncbi:hypothetical protein [Dermabacter hominis]|uniref:hypothetical protein n=1 Tax=Dermabacter hominis TaxID=36740 RepID=UPI0021A4BA3C|nr:hypothetical protein [Dermabacter hominis]MDU4692607.1 hypothetical protein [Dermabacter sp.]MCT1789248.1 hypothetical protein [Dermabacter hominis]MCT2055821.1 hypothetical protein [Dermabacter hominis]MCT2083488.1 hypothetical protein [Dermabacter hominis]MCT2090740.1 hypothetical protein [Dermabacter hominis]
MASRSRDMPDSERGRRLLSVEICEGLAGAEALPGLLRDGLFFPDAVAAKGVGE